MTPAGTAVPRLALKVDVDTLRGTRIGVPRLLTALGERNLRATFLFSLGPDHTGWALRRIFRPGFFAKVARTSVVEHYGLMTLANGVLWPGPDIGARAADIMRRAHAAGHECGIHTWDHVLWQDQVRERDAAWTEAQMNRAWERYRSVFGEDPKTHGAAGWQMNAHALAVLDRWGLRYASDGRWRGSGAGVHRLEAGGHRFRCIQLPTTLPTLDELIGIDGRDAEASAELLLRRTAQTRCDHVFTLHAELEGGRLLPAFLRLLDGWRDQGYAIGTLEDSYRALPSEDVPYFPLGFAAVPGRAGTLLLAPVRA